MIYGEQVTTQARLGLEQWESGEERASCCVRVQGNQANVSVLYEH